MVLQQHDHIKAKANSALIFAVLIVCAFSSYGQPGCSPGTTNGNCLASVPLVVGDPCVAGTTCGGSAELGTCLFAGSECSWYSFTATATDMFVNIELTSTDGCHMSSNVIESTGSCVGTEISCLFGAPLDDVHILSGLTVGTVYYVQVCYPPGGACGNGGEAQYCISVGENDPLCNTCTTPCGTALGYSSTPTVQQVVDDCVTSPFALPLQPGTLNEFCNSFTATATSVDFNVIITSNCAGGNVTNFGWFLYNAPACGAPIQFGDLTSLTFNGLTIGNDYVFCYRFMVPLTCTHSQHCPYFVGAIVLPVNLLSFNAEVVENSMVDLNWSTASEMNNDYFAVEKSMDNDSFELVGYVQGQGNSVEVTNYNLTDKYPYSGLSYYRLKQTDHNGEVDIFDAVPVELINSFSTVSMIPNPVHGNGILTFDSRAEGILSLKVYDVFGRVVISEDHNAIRGPNSIPLQTELFSKGVYIISLYIGDKHETFRFIKDQ